MVLMRNTTVESSVWDEQTLSPNRGDDEGSFTITFHPAPGPVTVVYSDKITRAVAKGAARARLRRPVGPPVFEIDDDGGVLVPPDAPVPVKRKARIEIGPVGGPLTELYKNADGTPTVFTVAGVFGPGDTFDPDRPTKLPVGARPPNQPTTPGPHVCRITNISEFTIRSFVSVHYVPAGQ
jgi:hypothetical protein